MMKTMNKIEKIWFDGEWLYGLGDDGNTYRQSLLWYKNLLHATQTIVFGRNLCYICWVDKNP